MVSFEKVVDMKIYTKQGDKGKTAVYTSTILKLDKDDILLECYGTLDELNSFIGLCISALGTALIDQKEQLLKCQQHLFTIGFALSDTDKLLATSIEELEHAIDEIQSKLPIQTSFILPGGSQLSAYLHVTRTIARRAERRLVTVSKHHDVSEISLAYINRLSDYLFVLARYSNFSLGTSEFEI